MYQRPSWCGAGSNRRHKDFQSFALPTELPHHLNFQSFSAEADTAPFDFTPTRLNRAAKIGDIPNKRTKRLKRIIKKSTRLGVLIGLFIIHALIAVSLYNFFLLN